MRVAAVGEGLLERVAVAANVVPRPLVETQIAFIGARAIMAGVETGVFEALADGSRDAAGVAQACGTDPNATRELLDCLVSLGYLSSRRGRYRTTRVTRTWLLHSSPVSMADKLRFQLVEWDWTARLEEFVRTGKALDLHARGMTPEQWARYQDAMRAVSVGVAPAVAKSVPMPEAPTAMLDIGGSHGLFSVALCRRYPTLRSTVLELPAAAEEAGRLLAQEETGGRVTLQAGNALTDDLGEERFDLVLMSNVAHHFSDEQNRGLARRVAVALKPGGAYVIGEFVRRHRASAGDGVAATAGLYFALTSTSGTWQLEEIQDWQRSAGLVPGRPTRYRILPNYATVPARKP
jgi:SAM-dependent methyltransferase